MSEQAFKLTKLDAARRQLHVALEMWFSEADPVAAHTLINAAHRNSGGSASRAYRGALMASGRIVAASPHSYWIQANVTNRLSAEVLGA